jgi:hypothetical protein
MLKDTYLLDPAQGTSPCGPRTIKQLAWSTCGPPTLALDPYHHLPLGHPERGSMVWYGGGVWLPEAIRDVMKAQTANSLPHGIRLFGLDRWWIPGASQSCKGYSVQSGAGCKRSLVVLVFRTCLERAGMRLRNTEWSGAEAAVSQDYLELCPTGVTTTS